MPSTLAVSNTSPISNLASIGRLDLLISQTGELLIPDAVLEELSAHPLAAARASIQDAIDRSLIRVVTVTEVRLLGLLESQLDRGEAEAIALAIERGARPLFIDERDGRRLALQSGLEVTGTLGVLLRAKSDGVISAVGPEIAALRSKARFYVSERLVSAILRLANE